jgi:acetyltransferase-like isoleucine patch superfamily enzyme
MRENIIQSGTLGEDGRIHIGADWYPLGLPANVELDPDVYIDTSYGFSGFHSVQATGLKMGKGSGSYDRASFITGKSGQISIGQFCIINGATFISNKSIQVGNHCMFAWGSVVTDCWIDPLHSTQFDRKEAIYRSLADETRAVPYTGEPCSVIVEDNVWVGFDTVVFPGSTIGRGSIVGSKTVIQGLIPPYAIVAGNPARIIRFLTPDDTEEFRLRAMKDNLNNLT